MRNYRQQSLFDFEEIHINKPIRSIELFGGYGSQSKALENIGADFEHYKLVEFDRYAVRSYNAVHNTNFVPMDITKISGADLEIVDTDKYCYIMTYSFPCQDLSIAGKQKGMKKGSGTRSGLLWEVERLLNETEELPQVLLMENVSQVHSDKNINNFKAWIKYLESRGYKNYWQDLNAKDYGVAQNRNRCFMVSTLYDEPFIFPQPIELKKCLRDYLEPQVDEKYYLSDKSVEYIIDLKNKTSSTKWADRANDGFINKSVAYTLSCFGCKNIQRASVSNYICKDLPQDTPVKNLKRCLQVANVHIGNNESNNRVYSTEGTSTAITTAYRPNITSNYSIRKLTPKECGRLMGMKDGDIDKMMAVNSNSQCYKQFGNSIVVPVLEAIFRNMNIKGVKTWDEVNER